MALQRKAGIPESSAEASLELDRRLTEGWQARGGGGRLLLAAAHEDRDLSPSPLISSIPEGDIDVPVFESWKEMIFRLSEDGSTDGCKGIPR